MPNNSERLKALSRRATERTNTGAKELSHADPEMGPAEIEFNDALEVICSALLHKAEVLADCSSRTVISCLTSLLRKEVAAHLTPGARTGKSLTDNRERKWSVKIWFWDVTHGMAMAELIAENDDEIIQGLPAIGDAIREYAQDLHNEDGFDASKLSEFSAVARAKRMGGMHPAISKGGGEATLRVRYTFGDEKYYICQADISRA